MTDETIRVIFWGYAPQHGKPVYMAHHGTVFQSIPRNPGYSATRYMQEGFWPEIDFLEQQITIHGYEIGRSPYRHGFCQVDVSQALRSGRPVGFYCLQNLKQRSGLTALDQEPVPAYWEAIAFITEHQKKA